MSEEKIDFDRFARKKQELINRLSNRDPGILARNTSTNFTANKSDGGEFTFSLWDVETIVSFPEFYALEKITGNKLAELDQVMLLYYFDHADRTPLSNNWISFSELPDGQFYNQAFQGYTGNILVRSFSETPSIRTKKANSWTMASRSCLLISQNGYLKLKQKKY